MKKTIENLAKECFSIKVENAKKRLIGNPEVAAQFAMESFFSMHKSASDSDLEQLLVWEIEDAILAGKQLDERMAK